MNFKLFVLPLFIVCTLSSVSFADETEYKSMEQMMDSIRLEKKQVESMVDKMIVSGRISAEDGVKAKRELASLKESDLENIKKLAVAEIKNKQLLDH